MTGVDTAVLRSLAERALLDPAAWGPFLSGALHPVTVRALCDGYDEAARLRGEVERLGAMAEWLAEVIVDARDACQRAEQIEPQGSPDWVASGIAMRKTALREVRQVLDRERNANPSRYDAARQALADLVADLRALCDGYESDGGIPKIGTRHLRAVIDRHAPATPTTEEDR